MIYCRRYFLNILGGIAWLFFSSTALGDLNLEALLDKAASQNLASHPTWIKLGHFERNRSSSSGWTSEIHSASFFLAPNGKENPKAELEATIKVFAAPAPDNTDLHAQCLFPGRYIWLSSLLDFDAARFPNVSCTAFKNWTKGESIKSISLLYATGYLGNPASFYGHTLLKFNSDNSAHSSLLDVSVNYGAIVPPGEGPIPYIFKGVTGGYDAGFSHIQYYFHNHNYGELELRDIWEYELAFSQFQVDLIMGHLWELLGKKYTYYFFRKNCGFRMAEVLELADGLDIIPRKHPYVFPQTLVMNLSQASINGKPAVSNVKYQPSRQSRLYHKYSQLTFDKQKVVKALAQDVELLNELTYTDLGVDSKKAVLETVQDYLQFAEGQEHEEGVVKEKSKAVLAARFRLPVGEVFSSLEGKNPPHLGRKPSYIQVSGLTNSHLNGGLSIRIRPSYYDALDAGNGHVANSELTMADTEVVYLNNRLSLRKLNIVSVDAVNGGRTGMPGDNGKTWRLKLGVEKQSLSCKNCLVARFQGDIGLAKNINDFAVMCVAVGGAVQNNRNDYGAFYSNVSAFTNLKVSNKTHFRMEFENRYHFDSNKGYEAIYSLQGRYRWAKNTDVRFMYQRNRAEEFSVSIGYYW